MKRYTLYGCALIVITALSAGIAGCSPAKGLVPVTVRIGLFSQNTLHTLSSSTLTGNTSLPTLTALQFHIAMYDLRITGTGFSPIHVVVPASLSSAGTAITALVEPGANRYFSLTAIPDSIFTFQSGSPSPSYSYYYASTQADIAPTANQVITMQMQAVPQTTVTISLVDPSGAPYGGEALVVVQDMDTGYQLFSYGYSSYLNSVYSPATLTLPIGYSIHVVAIDGTNMSTGTVDFMPFTSTITQTTITMTKVTQTTISGSYSGSLWVGEGITPLAQSGLVVQLFTGASTPAFSTTTDAYGSFHIPDMPFGSSDFEIIDPITQNMITSYSVVISYNGQALQSRLPIYVPSLYTMSYLATITGTYPNNTKLLCLIPASKANISFDPPPVTALIQLTFTTSPAVFAQSITLSAVNSTYPLAFDTTPLTGTSSTYTVSAVFADGSDIPLMTSPWYRFHGNMQSTGLSTIDTGPDVGALSWSFTTGNQIVSSPVIGADGTIYVGSNDDRLYAFYYGGLKWSCTTNGWIQATPAIGLHGTIYASSYDGNLYAVNPDGTVKWLYTTGNNLASSPVVGPDGTIYVGSNDDHLYAIAPTGVLKWSFTTGNWVKSTPAIGADGTIYVGSQDDYLYAITPTGGLKWSFPTGNYVLSSPAIGPDGTIYIGSYDHNLYAITQSGGLSWSYTTGNSILSTPAIAPDGTIYVGSQDGALYALSPTGGLKWSYTTGNAIWSSPAIGADGTVYVGSYDDRLYAITPTGGVKWSYTTGNWIYSSPAIGADGTVYVGSDDGTLYAIH